MEHKESFYWLDLLRGISAFVVLTGHLRALFFNDYSPTNNFFASTFYFCTGFGHQAVVVFFVLSGFFIIRSIDLAHENQRWSFVNYAIDRLSRLWIVLIPALVITFLLDMLATKYFEFELGYSGNLVNLPGVNPHHSSNVMSFIGNLFFLQNIYFPTFGSNGALWSLSCEFWYYFVFPFLYLLFRKNNPRWHSVLYIIVALAAFIIMGKNVLLYYIIWLTGGLAYYLYKLNKGEKIFSKLWFCLLFLILFFICLICIRFSYIPVVFNDFSLGLITSLLILSLIYHKMEGFKKKIAVYISNISYTLYAIHLPISVFVVNLFFTQRHSFTAFNFIVYSSLFIVTVLICTLFWYMFERNTSIVKKWIKNKIYVQQPI